MRKLREGMVPTAVWGVVCLLAVLGARAGWNAIYADWETNGQNFSEQPRQNSTPISTRATLSHPAASAVPHDVQYCLGKKQEILAQRRRPDNIFELQPGQITEWTSLSENAHRNKAWFVMSTGQVREYIRFWDDTYIQVEINENNTTRDTWDTPAKDARWGAWRNEDTKPVTVTLWKFD